MKLFRRFLILFAILTLPCIGAAVDSTAPEPGSAVVTHYADLLFAEYQDSLASARQLQTNIEAFLGNPTQETFEATKRSWITCRQPYSQTEIARFYDGPIEAVEGFVNAWPIDQNYLDYTSGAPDSGIINNVAGFPQITRDIIVGANEREGEKTISTGFHAIEFLLWGQDLYADSPGKRSHTDYIDAPDGPGRHAARRRQYLRLLAQLLVDDLQVVTIQWSPGQPNSYRARFLAMPADAALAKMFAGAGNLSSSELTNERILVPFATRSQENEQCCFSDTTHLDLIRNQMGLRDVFLGRYTRADGSVLEGPGLLALLEKRDAKLAVTLQQQLGAAQSAIQAIQQPFDQAILGDDSAPGRVAIKKALDALQAQNASIAKAAAVLGIQLNLK
jgi:putative iron-regulated protein